MSWTSFRLKIALLSGLLTGLLLVGTGVVVWRISYQFNLNRLDREIRHLGQGNLDREHGPAHYQRFEEALAFISGEDPSLSIVMLVRNQQDRVIYVSRYWPTNLDTTSFLPLTGKLLPASSPPEPGLVPPRPPPEAQPPRPEPPPLPRKVPRFETRVVDGQSWRFGVMGNPYNTLVLGMNIEQFNADMLRLQRACLLGLPMVLLLAGVSAWFLAQRALRPVSALTQMAERVTARGLDQRIPAMTRDREFNRLVTVFNEMLDRLEKSFQQANRFSADASHELRTPLARLQAELEQALDNAAPDSEQQQVYSSLLDEISRLKSIVQKLLLLSLADAGQLNLKRETVNLTQIVNNVMEDCRAQAPGLSIEASLAAEVQVEADPDLLEQALQNLASNAIKHNSPNGRIIFELVVEEKRALVRIANTGPGIPAAARERLFQRFYRGDRSRSSRTEGVGLGLSLAREIVRAHGGDVVLENSTEAATSFCLTLPSLTRAPGRLGAKP